MPTELTVEEFIANVESREGPPPAIPGLRSWRDLARKLREVPVEDIRSKMEEVERTFKPPTIPQVGSGPDYSRWSPDRRAAANLEAVRALRDALARGEATLEQRVKILDYTGFGGLGDVGILPDEYPREYVEASKAWARAKRVGGAVPAEFNAIMQRVKDQYFTPLDAAQAAWVLAERTNPRAEWILEPSAGSGRFLRTGPAGRNWVAVEMDTLLADMLRMCFPHVQVFPGMFELYAKSNRALKEQGQRFDIVIGNPPYGARGLEMQETDLSQLDDAEDYFTLRGASLLRRGGTLVYLVRLNFLTQPGHREARERMVKSCLFRGAAILPSKVFPAVRETTFVIMLWSRRPETIRELKDLTERDRTIIEGDYLTLPEAAAATCGGEWKEGTRGRFLYGAPEYQRVNQLWLAPMELPPELKPLTEGPMSDLVLRRPPEVMARIEEPKKGRKGRARGVADVETLAVLPPEAQAAVEHVRRFLHLVGRDPTAAEAERGAVRQSVVNYLMSIGNPHPRGPAPMRAVVAKDGTLEPVLTEAVASRVYVSLPPENASFSELVGWWSERQGYATASDLKMEEEDALGLAVDDPDVYIEMRPEGPAFFAHWAYFTGPPAARLQPIDAFLGSLVRGSGDGEGAFRRKLEGQKALILEQWASAKTLPQLDATPRSPFVPLEALVEWVNDAIRHKKDKTADLPRIKLVVEDGLMSIPTGDPGLEYAKQQVKRTWDAWNLAGLYWLLAFYNRSTRVENLKDDSDRKGATVMVYGQTDAKGIENTDKHWVSKFQAWLGDSSWAMVVENEYNTKFAPPLLSQIPTDDVELAGQGHITLHPHQNQAVRRASMGGRSRPLLCAFDVGAGKTFVGIATAMRWVQMGTCSRVLIVVPASVLAKWYADARKLFPHGRIGIIGITPGRRATDTPEVRLEKWLRFASGAYDITIVSNSFFLQDLEPDPNEVADLLSGVLWARRQMGEQIAVQRQLIAKVEEIQAAIEAHEKASSWGEYRALHKKFSGSWEEHRERTLKRLRIDLAEAEQKAGEKAEALGTDNEVAKVQDMLQRLVADKPYRPEGKARKGETYVEVPEYDDDSSSGDEAEGKGKKPKGKLQKTRVEGLVAWSDMAVDGLVIDEAHRFRNLWTPAEKIEYAGSGEDRLFKVKSAWDMWFKTASVHRKHGGMGGVEMLTATPMVNSPLDLYALLCMVAPTLLPSIGIHDKEAFIDRYWDTQVKDVVRPNGLVEPAKALVGFKNFDELMGLISGVFDRKSTAQLVAMGWLKKQPEPIRQDVWLDRDNAQTALIRTLVAMVTAWTKPDPKKEADMTPEERARQRALDSIDLARWSLDDRGQLVRGPVFTKDSAPTILTDRETMRKARGVLRLIWMGLLDKAATDPQLVLRYAAEIESLSPWVDDYHRRVRYAEALRRGETPAGNAPAPLSDDDHAEMLRVVIATSLLEELPLQDIRRYYQRHPVVPKIAALASFIRDLTAQDRKVCGHVIFCEWTEAHEQIAQAIVAATARLPEGQRITRDRIAFITGDVDKPQRLVISNGTSPDTAPEKAHGGFNGRSRVVVDGIVLEEELEPIYDIVIGTTGAMAEGIDLQRRSCAVHHLDLPWQPAALQQRNGRAVRQGNLIGRVFVRYYLTKKTYDSLRFDKIVRKNAWWDDMFDGQASMSNPAAEDDTEVSQDELILTMVIDNEEELKIRLDELKAVRSAELRSKRVAKAADDWLALNALFEKVRSTMDPQRQDALMRAAIELRNVWKISHAEFVVPEALPLLNEHTVLIDWAQGTMILPNHAYELQADRSRTDRRLKVLEILVRPHGMVVRGRAFGQTSITYEEEHGLMGARPIPLWSFAQEEADVVRSVGSGEAGFASLANLPRDLFPHALSLMRSWVHSRLGSASTWDKGRFSLTNQSALLLAANNQVLCPVPFWEKELQSVSVRSEVFLQSVLESVTAVLPLDHPDAWSTWVRALRSDRILAPHPVGGVVVAGRSVDLGLPDVARTGWDTWERLTFLLFRRAVPAEVLRQRIAITGEPPSEKRAKASKGTSRQRE